MMKRRNKSPLRLQRTKRYSTFNYFEVFFSQMLTSSFFAPTMRWWWPVNQNKLEMKKINLKIKSWYWITFYSAGNEKQLLWKSVLSKLVVVFTLQPTRLPKLLCIMEVVSVQRRVSRAGWDLRYGVIQHHFYWWCFSNLNERNFMMNFLVPGPHKDSNK